MSLLLKNTEHAYGWVLIVMHWLMALAIFGLFALGLWMTSLGYYDAWYHRAPDIHKSIGMLVLFLLIFRLIWIGTNVKPAIVGKAWEQTSALVVHRDGERRGRGCIRLVYGTGNACQHTATSGYRRCHSSVERMGTDWPGAIAQWGRPETSFC